MAICNLHKTKSNKCKRFIFETVQQQTNFIMKNVFIINLM